MGTYWPNMDSLKCRSRHKGYSTLHGVWKKGQETIGKCVNHPNSAWNQKYSQCYMGFKKSEPCKLK